MHHVNKFLDLLPQSRGNLRSTFPENATVFCPFTCEWEETGIAIHDRYIIGLGSYRARREIDLKGARVVPGLIDSHVHIESSLLTPEEYAGVVSACGTTTVIADPHEIANVLGTAGIEYMLRTREGLMVDILLMLPSCVPATPLDQGGARLDAEDLAPFIGREGVIGLGEMMNVPGVLSGDEGIWRKLALSSMREGHSPFSWAST